MVKENRLDLEIGMATKALESAQRRAGHTDDGTAEQVMALVQQGIAQGYVDGLQRAKYLQELKTK